MEAQPEQQRRTNNFFQRAYTALFTNEAGVEPGDENQLGDANDQLGEAFRLVETYHRNVDDAVAYLDLKCYGKKIDESYVAYISTLFFEWADARHISIRDRLKMSQDVLIRHRNNKLNAPDFWTVNSVRRAQEYNNALKGKIPTFNMFKPWTWFEQDTSLVESGNGSEPIPKYSSTRYLPFIAAALGTALALTGAKSIISGLSSTLGNLFTTLNPTRLLPQPTTTDIVLSVSPSIPPPSFTDFIVTLKDSGVILISILENNIVTPCLRVAKETSIEMLQNIWTKVGR